MGAIAGIVYPDTFQVTDLINPMIKTLQHRGSQNETTYTYKNIQVAVTGNRMGSDDKRSIIAFLDGLITNAAGLRQELEKLGQRFQTDDAAEIVAKAYESWGMQAIGRIDGDFAIAILDHSNSKVILARDRIGKRPLYWFHDQHHFIFASEIKALLATGMVPKTPALDAIATYLAMGYFPQDLTPIQGMSKLLPAHYLVLDFSQHKAIHNYWHYSSCFQKQSESSPQVISETLEQLLESSVSQRLPSKTKVGCLVSGGIGSASVAYYVDKMHHSQGVMAFTAGFEKGNPEDIRAAEEVARAIHMPQIIELINPEHTAHDLVKIAWHLDEPLDDPNVLAIWRLARLAAANTDTVFSGMGCDELLAGHGRYTITERAHGSEPASEKLWRTIVRNAIVPLLRSLSFPQAFALLRHTKTNPWQAEYLKANAVFDEHILSQAAPSVSHFFDPEVFLHKFHNLHRIRSRVSSFLYLDIKTRLPDHFMLQLERLTSAFGLTWQTPFLDTQIVEYLAGLPEPEELNIEDTAAILKSLMQGHLPSSVIDRPKSTRRGFLGSWANIPPISDAFDLLQTGTLVDAGLISPKWLRSVLISPDARISLFRQLWSLLMLELWFRLFINRPVHSTAPDVDLLDFLRE